MITWMQRHKKWLIVTIWVSTIAFVGAGFVGWGSYNYGKSDGAVATVNGNEVPLSDLQNEYNALYSQYAQMFGSSFNQELAKQLNLEQIALQKTIQKHLFLNYAEELGLTVTDTEMAKEIAKIKAFYKDGKFDKATYETVLRQNRKTLAEFESQLKQDLTVQKIQKLFSTQLTNSEIDNIGSLLFSEDKVSIKIIDTKGLNINLSDDEIKQHWEKTKENYKTPKGYAVSYSKIENIENKTKKEMKRVALKEYLQLKKDQSKFTQSATVYDDSSFLPKEDFKEIVKASPGTVLKPIYKENNYYVVRVDKKIAPQALPFEEVKEKVKSELTSQRTALILEKKAKNALENFEGADIGYINRATSKEISGLSNDESFKFIQELFASSKKEGFINLGSKAVVYNITDTKLLETITQNGKDIVKNNVQNMKSSSVINGLLSTLEKRYEIKSYMENK
jgi:peptidyl-prolyl cis-trans isomerase D